MTLVTAILAVTGSACTGDDDDDDAAQAIVSGTVEMDDTGGSGPVVGGTVEALGGDSVTTEAAGAYSISIDADSDVFLRISGGGLYPTQRGVVAPEAGLTGVNLSGPSDALVSAVGGILGVTLDDSKGILSVNFEGASVTSAGGLSATIGLAADGSFTFDSSGSPVQSTTTLPNGDTTVIFYNVTPGSTSITPSGVTGCTANYGITNFRVSDGTITEVSLDCD